MKLKAIESVRDNPPLYGSLILILPALTTIIPRSIIISKHDMENENKSLIFFVYLFPEILITVCNYLPPWYQERNPNISKTCFSLFSRNNENASKTCIFIFSIFRGCLEYPFHHFLLLCTRFISRRNFLKATCHSFPQMS